jgi:hypothetical protein
MKREGTLAWFAIGTGLCLYAVLMFVLLISALYSPSAYGAANAPSEAHLSVQVPSASYLYRFKLEREVASRFGTTDSVARIAGQGHAESLWRSDARSAYAQGLYQFTPATAKWIVSVCPEIGVADPWDPNWSVRAAVCYDHWLFARVDSASDCDRWAFVFSAYNGGLGWVQRDRAMAVQQGFDPQRWWGHVERVSSRADWAFDENRGYVERILHQFEPVYLAAGWPGQRACP